MRWCFTPVMHSLLRRARKFFCRRLQPLMARATVEGCMAGLCQTLRTVRHLICGLSFHDVSALCMHFLAHRLPGRIQAWCRGTLDAGLWGSLTRKEVRTRWVALSAGSRCDLKQSDDSNCLMGFYQRDVTGGVEWFRMKSLFREVGATRHFLGCSVVERGVVHVRRKWRVGPRCKTLPRLRGQW